MLSLPSIECRKDVPQSKKSLSTLAYTPLLEMLRNFSHFIRFARGIMCAIIRDLVALCLLLILPINIYTRTRRRNFISLRERHGFARRKFEYCQSTWRIILEWNFSADSRENYCWGGNRGKLYFMSLAKFPVYESECLSVPTNSVSLCSAYTQRHVNAPATQFVKEWRSYEPSASEFISRIDLSDTNQRKYIFCCTSKVGGRENCQRNCFECFRLVLPFEGSKNTPELKSPDLEFK